jgi:hypothetical protein
MEVLRKNFFSGLGAVSVQIVKQEEVIHKSTG